MPEPTSAVPPGVYPYLTVSGGKAAIAFYEMAFGAVEEFRSYGQDGEKIMHARIRVNGAALMISDDFRESRDVAQATSPSRVTIHLEVEDADAWWKRAVAAGATITMPLGDQFWGDRYGQLADPFGHAWSIGAPIRT